MVPKRHVPKLHVNSTGRAPICAWSAYCVLRLPLFWDAEHYSLAFILQLDGCPSVRNESGPHALWMRQSWFCWEPVAE